MTLADIDAKISELTQSDTNLYPNANRLINANIWYRNVQTAILKSQDDFDFDDSNQPDYPIFLADLVANQQSYTLPLKTLEIKRAEVTYDGTNWNKVSEFDVGERLESTATNALGDFTTNEPHATFEYNSIFLYPIPLNNVTRGLKLWTSRLVSEFSLAEYTSGTMEPGFDALFHDIIAYGASFEWLVSKDIVRANNVKVILDEKIQSLYTHYGRKVKDEDLSLNSYPVSYK